MASDKIAYRVHAIQRMFERRISEGDVERVLMAGEVIESYPDDTPYPSRLILGWRETRPLHVVAAENEKESETIIVTAYEPTADQWEAGFTKRRKS